MTEAAVRDAFRIQQQYCAANAAPTYASICGALADVLAPTSAVGARVLGWPGEPTRDALPLRLCGGLHALVLAGADAELAAIYAGRTTDLDAIAATLVRVSSEHGHALLPWLDGPPQTNEPGRSAALMLGLLDIARASGPRVELLEIGSSAGLNLLIGRYGFDLGGVRLGPAEAPVVLAPAWHGPPPLATAPEIVSARGCDVAPLDATDPAVAARLAAYVWPDAPERLARLRAAIAMLRKEGVDLVRADAADWVEARLAEPQPAGTTRVLMHSVVWQYLPEPVAARIRAAMAAAARHATVERPLGWVAMEPDRAVGHQAVSHQVVRARHWPDAGGRAGEWRTLATSHAHGAWIDTAAGRGDAPGGDLPEPARIAS